MDRLAAMETFIRVVQARSFSAAARHLNVGQPAVSKSVAQLEERLGVRLLMRSTRGLMPTEAGQNYYERARRAIEEANEADLAARGASADLAGRLRVGACGTFLSLHVVPRLPLFLASHPRLSIDFILDDREIDLIEEGVDVALRIGALRDSSLTVRKVATSQRLVLGTPAYFERAGLPTAPAELVKHRAVIYTQETGFGTWCFRQGTSKVSVSMASALRVSAAEGVRAAVLGGIGLAIVPAWMFAPELASGAVRQALPGWTLPPSGIWAVFPAGRMATAKARAFAAFVEAELRRPNVVRQLPPPIDFDNASSGMSNAL